MIDIGQNQSQQGRGHVQNVTLHPTIDRTIGRRVPLLIVRSVTGCQEYLYERSHDVMIDRTIGRLPSRLIVRSVATIARTIGRRAQ